jgi:hypothetical protein
VLPSFVGKIGWFLGPYWGFRGIREATLGTAPWRDIGMSVAISLAYFAVGSLCLRAFVRVARRTGSLKLT